MGLSVHRDPAGDADRHPGAEPALWKKRGAIAVGESTDDTASSDGNAERFGTAEGVSVAERKPLGVAGVLAIRGAKEILVMFFCYCAVESTAGLWASSYMVMHSGIDKITAASWASLFYVASPWAVRFPAS